jgi:hypothetical protein
MKNLKQYKSKDGLVDYTYSPKARKWTFTISKINYTFVTGVIGQAEGAERVANIIAGSAKRKWNGTLDNLARHNMREFVK